MTPEIEPTETAFRTFADGTPEAIGVLALVNDPSVTKHELDVDAALDRRAAESITEYRAGNDGVYEGGLGDDRLFVTIGQVDDQYYVGPVALSRLLDYATTQGYVPSGTDLLGTWDDVAFTVDEAEDALRWVNQSTEAQLDAVLDSRAVDSILDARAIVSIQQLSGLYYVGPAAMFDIREEGRAIAEPMPCISNAECPGILSCVGVPDEDGFSRCQASQGIPGQGLSCTALGDCAEDLVCSGFTIFGTGECRPAWMAHDFTSEPGVAIGAAGTTTDFTVDVAGLASVPEDIIVTVDLQGVDPAGLRLVLADPQGTLSPLWDGPAAGGAPIPSELLALEGISRDDNVNGTWTLHVENVGSPAGTLAMWNLYLSSRFD
ncbi:MAG: hypothetical protein AAF799_28180 [Myxococcota bacterium]